MPLLVFLLLIWFLGPVFIGVGVLIVPVFLLMALLLLFVDFTNGCLRLKASEERRDDAAVALGAWTFLGWLITADFLGEPLIAGGSTLVCTGIGAAIGFLHGVILMASPRHRRRGTNKVRSNPRRGVHGRFIKARNASGA